MALCAAMEDVQQAWGGASTTGGRPDPARVGLILGTGAGGIDFTLDQFNSVNAGGNASLWTITNATHGNLAGELSIRLGLRGPSLCVSTGCASASDAAGLAMRTLRDQPRDDGRDTGRLDAFVVVGADA